MLDQILKDPNLPQCDRIAPTELVLVLAGLFLAMLVEIALITGLSDKLTAHRIPVEIGAIHTEYATPFLRTADNRIIRLETGFRGALTAGKTCRLKLSENGKTAYRSYGCD